MWVRKQKVLNSTGLEFPTESPTAFPMYGAAPGPFTAYCKHDIGISRFL